MQQSHNLYDSSRLAVGYAFRRPPVHAWIAKEIRDYLPMKLPVWRALDVGCAAGLSTAVLEPLAEKVVGIDPIHAMLRHCETVAPNAKFVVGQAERLPFPKHKFDLMTAAGSVNYVDLELFLPEVARVLAPSGVLVIYDFSAGRRVRENRRLEEWYHTFERRYPPPPGYALDVKALPYSRSSLRLEAYKELEIGLEMSLNSYLSYILTETSVESTISRGQPEAQIREWCKRSLLPVFGEETLEVLFDSYVVYVKRVETT